MTPENKMRDSYDQSRGPISRERLNELQAAIENLLPDHCGFVLMVAEWNPTADAKPVAYISNIRAKDAKKACLRAACALNEDP